MFAFGLMPETTTSTGVFTMPINARATQSEGAPSLASALVPSARMADFTRSGRLSVFTCPEADQLWSGARMDTSPSLRNSCTSASSPGA